MGLRLHDKPEAQVKITGIKQQLKRADRYSIYVDEKYAFSLSESALLTSGLASGQEITSQQLDDFKKLSAEDKLYNRALRYVAMRSRSVWEVQVYLRRKDAPEALQTQIIERLTGLGLLDDHSYAASFVRDRQLLRPTSRRKLVLELKQKHINEEAIRHALDAGELDETHNLAQVIAKKRRQSKYQDEQKLMQYLARQGFGYGDIKAALTEDVED